MINPNCLKTSSSLVVCFCFFMQFGKSVASHTRISYDLEVIQFCSGFLSWSVEPLCMVKLPVTTHLLELKLWSGRWERFLYYFFVLCQYEKSHDFRKLKFSFSRLIS